MVEDMQEKQNLIPAWVGKGMIDDAFDDRDHEIDELKHRWEGSTFVTLEDCVKLQVMSKNDGFDSVDVLDERGERHSVQFRGQWPRKLTWVHSITNHGASIPMIPVLRVKDVDSRLVWISLAMHVCVPQIWESTVSSVSFAEDWHGWILTYLTSRCLRGKGKKGFGSPFSFRALCSQESQDTKIVSVFLRNLGVSRLNCPRVHIPVCQHNFGRIFETHSNILIMGENFDTSAVSTDHDVVMLVKDTQRVLPDHNTELLEFVRDGCNGVWEARFLAKDLSYNNGVWAAVVYARHGGLCFPGWWMVERTAMSISSVKATGDDFERLHLGWQVCVYVRLNPRGMTNLRDKFLTSINGQTNLQCPVHGVPLVVAPYQSGRVCGFMENGSEERCGKMVWYACPYESCGIQLCKNHFNASGVERMAGIVSENASEPYPFLNSEHGPNHSATSYGDDNETCSSRNSDLGDAMVDDTNSYEEHLNVQNVDDESDVETCGEAIDMLVDTPFDMCLPDASDDEGSAAAEELLIPTTNCTSAALTVGSRKRSFVGGHVILNHCGTLLARKRKKLNATRQQQHFLQRIVTTFPGKSIPLIYPEAMLFPSLFWKDDRSGESILGAIPCALMSQKAFLQDNGLASIQEHLRIRLTDPSFAGSSDFRYICYAFDCVLNLACRGEDTRIILNRGVEVDGSRYGVKAKGSNHPLFDTDSVDSRPVVNRLAAAMAEHQATYFYTHTCNQSEHFGVREIKKWIDSEDVLDHLCCHPYCWSERNEVRRSVLNGSSLCLCRNWMEVSELWMTYLLKSEERPLGQIDRMWWRHEYQDVEGNLSHIHALLWLLPESAETTEERIRGTLLTLIRPSEIDAYIQMGLLDGVQSLCHVYDKAGRFLRHRCSNRCMMRTGSGNGEVKCRVTSNGDESYNPREHTTEEIWVCHSEEALSILETLGLYAKQPGSDWLLPAHELLRATKHYPPACSGEGVISACSGRLFLGNPCNQNLKIITGYLASRYLAKYVAGIDENNIVYIGAQAEQHRGVELDYEFLHNTKVTGSAIQEEKRKANRRDRRHPTGRAVSEMEMISVLLGYDQVHTNIKFVHVPTVPLEERPAIEMCSPKKYSGDVPLYDTNCYACARRPADLDMNSLVPVHFVRQDNKRMPLWRQLSNSELLILQDQKLSPFSIDATTVFGVRPPELRFVRKQCLYFRWFKRERLFGNSSPDIQILRKIRCLIHHELSKCHWIDGTNHAVKIRPAALPEVMEYLRNCTSVEHFYAQDHLSGGSIEREESPLFKMCRLFRTLFIRHSSTPRSSAMKRECQEMRDRFLCDTVENDSLPVIWYNSVRPTQSNRFLLHVLYSMGEFDNEVNLFGVASIKECYVRAGLIEPNPDCIEESVRSLARRYVLEQLVFLPGGSQQFDRFLAAAYRTLRHCLIHDAIVIDELPPALYTHLQAKTCAAIEMHLNSCKETLLLTVLKNLSDCGFQTLPHIADLSNFSTGNDQAIHWSATDALASTLSQLPQSIQEQRLVLDLASNRITQYQSASQCLAKSICIIGGPGVGKTTLLQLIVLETAYRGLNVAMTALMAERSRELGGHHLNQMFAIPVNEKAPVPHLAELAVVNLNRQPKRLAVLQRLDVLFVNELGQISAEMLAVLDIILRRIRDSCVFMGGVMVICTMDPLQLHPVSGRPALLSPHMITCFTVVELKHSVRASKDAILREIQGYTRKHPIQLTQDDIQRFRELIEKYCTFVRDWDDPTLTPNMLRVFGRKSATTIAEQNLLLQARARYTNVTYRHAVDEESTAEGNWIKATARTSRTLSKKVKEPIILYFFPFAQYELTFNDPQGRFSQSQLAVLTSVPTQDHVDRFDPIDLMLAPEGCKTVPSTFSNAQDYVNAGWKPISVGIGFERSESMAYGILGKRCQYGLKHRMACTIHASMGQNLEGLVTRVTSSEDSDYFLWEKEQVVVLLSRTHFAKDIYFVGDPRQTSAALADLLCSRSQYSEYIFHLLQQFAGSSSNNVPLVDMTLHPFHIMDVELPQDNSGFVYILVSVKDRKTTYIGQTKNLVRRLKQHNSGFGSSSTADEFLRPWALLAYVAGFDASTHSLLVFETAWKRKRDHALQCQHSLCPEQIAKLAIPLIESLSTTELRLVMCCYPTQHKTTSE